MSIIEKNQSGFTMLEIIVAMTVAGFIAVGLSVMVANLNVLSDRASDLIAANSAVENKFEDLRSSTFLGLTDGTVDFTDELPGTLSGPRSATYTIGDATLANVSDALKQIDMTITYNSHGRTETLNYTGYIGELGVGQY